MNCKTGKKNIGKKGRKSIMQFFKNSIFLSHYATMQCNMFPVPSSLNNYNYLCLLAGEEIKSTDIQCSLRVDPLFFMVIPDISFKEEVHKI